MLRCNKIVFQYMRKQEIFSEKSTLLYRWQLKERVL